MVERPRYLEVALDTAVALQGAGVSVVQACRWLGVSRAGLYRHRRPTGSRGTVVPHAARAYPNRLTTEEQAVVVARLNDDDVAELSIRQAFFRLLDAGTYLCSLASMHRIMRRVGQSADRRRRRPRASVPRGSVAAPTLHATAPRQVWCWDITNLNGPGRMWFKLYSMVDLYSRYAVAHRVEYHERPDLAQAMFADAFASQGCTPAVIHADNGGPMRAGTTRDLFRTLHITASYSRPHVSNDNPYAEAFFKTLKYDLEFPEQFASIEHARGWTDDFFEAYNQHHHHAGLAGHTPARVHDGSWPEFHDQWTAVKTRYAAEHPTRHARAPIIHMPPDAVWINKPNHQLSQTA